MPGIEAEVRALPQCQQSARQRRFAIDADQRFGANEVAGRAEQRVSTLDGPHFDAMNPLDRAAQDGWVDLLHAAENLAQLFLIAELVVDANAGGVPLPAIRTAVGERLFESLKRLRSREGVSPDTGSGAGKFI